MLPLRVDVAHAVEPLRRFDAFEQIGGGMTTLARLAHRETERRVREPQISRVDTS
jgi:hypothetical protein